MNKFITGFATALFIISLLGCASLLKNNEGIFGKAQKADQKIDQQIRSVENAQSQVNEDKLAHIGAWSKGGVEYSLNQIKTNIPPEVDVAKQMNERVEALAGKPDFKEVEAIQQIVKDLLSVNDKTREDGVKALASKDKEINKLEQHVKDLDHQREVEIANLTTMADANAKKVDQYKTTLNQMDSWFGLGAVFYGLKKFIISAAWILGIGSVLFLILRILSTTNPIASAIFGIFDQVGSWMIHTVAAIFPKALSIAGNVSSAVFNSYKSTLTKIVDAVQMAKTNATAANREATLKDVLNEAEKSMNSDEKAIVEDIKKSLNW